MTSAPANEALVSTGSVTFAGTAPYDYKTVQFEVTGCDPVEAEFSTLNGWTATVPVTLGRHVIALRCMIPAARSFLRPRDCPSLAPVRKSSPTPTSTACRISGNASPGWMLSGSGDRYGLR